MSQSTPNKSVGANVILGAIGAVAQADDLVETAKASLRASSTWKGLGFVFLKLWVGVASFVLVVTFLGVALKLLLLSPFPGGVLNVQVLSIEVADAFDTTFERALAVPAGAVLAVVALNVFNAFASVSASIAESLLDSGLFDADAVGASADEQSA